MAAASPPNPPATDAPGGPPKTPRTAPTPDEEIKAVARKFADQPLQNTDPGVWAVLTAISKKARQRQQGMNIILNGDEHRIGRLVEETRFQIRDIAVSANHCKISRVTVASGDNDSCVSVFLKDTSTNGTFHNWTKLRKGSAESRLQHGDIISLVSPPHEDHAYAFVYREVSNAPCSINGLTLKRKAEDCGTESKRSKGIGIGSADGPISLDDVRSLQRSNMDLRKQLEAQDLTIETLRGENRSFVAKHEIELKELKESMSSSFDSEIKEMQLMLDIRQKKLDEMKTMSLGLQGSIKDLNERLAALTQSRADADEIIQSQKTRILELETQLDEERNQRREERENAAADLKSSMQRVQAEAQEELKRQADKYLRESKEQSDLIAKYQDSEKESRELVDALRSKLEDSRENLIISEKKVRQLEAQVLEEKTASENCSKSLEAAELEIEKLKKELELEKQVAREEAWAKVSALELEIAAAMHELSVEKQRFQGARERIILRETQLRAFYSTTEEISALFAKQQEQLKAMQKTLEDEENCENLSIGFDLNACPKENAKGTVHNGVEISVYRENPREVPCGNPKNARSGAVSSSDDDDSMTEKHDCDVDSQEEGSDTQDMEYNSVGMSNKGFGSDINGCGTAPVHDGDPVETEQVQETESPVTARDEHKNALHRCSNLTGQTQMQTQTQTQQVDEEAETHIQNAFEKHDTDTLGGGGHLGSQSRLEGAEISGIGTADLLASEVPGSWVNCTPPSNHGENDSPQCTDAAANGQTEDAAAATPFLSGGQAEASQNAGAVPGVARLTEEHRALNTMIGIVAPELKQQFQTGYENNESLSDAETEEGSNQNGGDSGGSDDDGDSSSFNADNEVMIQDSAG